MNPIDGRGEMARGSAARRQEAGVDDGLAAGVALVLVLLDESDDVLGVAVEVDELESVLVLDVDELLFAEPPRLSVL